MMEARLLWDRFLYRVRESGLMVEGGRILDVGTGTNTTMLEMFGDRWDVTPSDVNVGEWNAHIPGMIQVDANLMGYDGEWDAVILSEILEHVEDPLNVLREAHKALRPEGLLIVSVPFLYRIHEYGNSDPETSEPGLKDYWRFTPNGLEHLLSRIPEFETIWVGRLVTDEVEQLVRDGKEPEAFPEWQSPAGVVGWGIKETGAWAENENKVQVVIGELDWKPDIQDNWRQHQTEMASDYARRVENARKELESA